MPDTLGLGGCACLDVQVQPSGFTAFMVACRNGNALIARALIEKGCNTGLTSSKGLTGWDLAHVGQQRDVRN